MKKLFYWFALAIALLLLPVDGFPWGIDQLREFGARPVNFILLFVFALEIVSLDFGKGIWPDKRLIALGKWLLVLFSLNLIVVVVDLPFSHDSPLAFREPLTAWFFQYLMALWMFMSFLLWIKIISRLKLLGAGYRPFVALLAVAALVNVLLFGNDIVRLFTSGNLVSDSIGNVLELFRGEYKLRPSGLSTEPSLFGAWVVFIWPLLIFHDRSRVSSARLSYCAVSTGALVILAGIASGALTFIIPFIAQGAIYFAFRMRRQGGFISKPFFFFVIAAPIAAFTLSPYFERIDELTGPSLDPSSMARLGSTVDSLNAIVHNPMFGIGIGQFSYYYAQYAPNFALDNPEVQLWAFGETDYRASTFNMITRIGAEVGLPGALLFCVIVFLIFSRLWALARSERFSNSLTIGIFLASIGGFAFWLTQDQFGYQPAIMVFAISNYYWYTKRSEIWQQIRRADRRLRSR